MFYTIKKDLSRYKMSVSKRGIIRIIRNNHGFKATLIYRYGQWIKKLLSTPLGFLPGLFLYPSFYLLDQYIKKAYGIYIHKNALIDKGLQIYHLGGIVIGPYKIGKNFTIHQHVKVGSLLNEQNNSVSLGNNVWIGAHGKINENITVGNNVVIQTGSVITGDVKDNCLMTGSPARVARMGYDNPELFRHY